MFFVRRRRMDILRLLIGTPTPPCRQVPVWRAGRDNTGTGKCQLKSTREGCQGVSRVPEGWACQGVVTGMGGPWPEGNSPQDAKTPSVGKADQPRLAPPGPPFPGWRLGATGLPEGKAGRG